METKDSLKKESPSRIIFYDGDCGLCNSLIQWILKIDKRNCFFFSPIQSKFANGFLPKSIQLKIGLPNPPKSLVYYKKNQFFLRSQAILEIGKDLGGMFLVFSYILSWIPNSILNILYDWVAKYRHFFWGNTNSCYYNSELLGKFSSRFYNGN